MEIDKLIRYWIDSADRDTKTMKHLFEKADYHWALFIGHLVLEKLLKAYFAQSKKTHPPFIHNLVRLADKAGIFLEENQINDLIYITSFNIEARYDDYKSDFYMKCTPEFTKKWIQNIEDYAKWIKMKLEE